MSEGIAPTIGQDTATVTAEQSEKPADAWEQPISAERQAELKGYLDRWAAQTDHGERKGPFDKGPGKIGVRLTGADVFWLAEQSGREYEEVPNLHLEGADLARAQLQGADLGAAHLERATLGGAHLERANLNHAHLEGALLRAAHLESATISAAHLERATISEAHLARATLSETRLEGSDLSRARLEGVNLVRAHLQGADLVRAQLQGAYLIGAHLEDTDFGGARLEGANLGGAWLDSKTVLSDAVLDRKTRLGDIHWSGVGAVDLTRCNWNAVPILGDEQGLLRKASVRECEAAVRAYRQLAAQLRAQGMSEVADRFAYRGQVLQRLVLRRQRRFGAAFGSWLLDLISGHGYKPMRSLIAYVVIICGFAAAYFLAAQVAAPHLSWDEALVLSISSFHGRGFFSPDIHLGDTLARLAAGEAIIGLLIEITFIATFTQRFFGSK